MSNNQTTTAATLIFYRRIVTRLRGSDPVEDTVAFGHLLGTRLRDAEIGRRSFKIYSAAVRTVLLKEALADAYQGFNAAILGAARPEATKRGSLKFVPGDVAEAILDQLSRRSARHSDHLASLLRATSSTGLRPKEWRGASLVGGAQPKLVVRNGKYRPPGTHDDRSVIGNGRRGNGPERTLLIDPNHADFEGTLEVIREMLDWERMRPWSDHQRGLRRELSAAIRDLVVAGKLPLIYQKLTPYSFRHQAAADAKASFDVSSGEAAALLGHASARTAVASYGRPRMGRSGMRVRAAEESVDLVDNLDTGSEAMRRFEVSRSNDQAPHPDGPLFEERKPDE